MSGLAIFGIVLFLLPLAVLVVLLPFFLTLGVMEVVARAIIDLRESSRALRVTRYLDSSFDPVIDLRDGDAADDDVEPRFRRHDRASGSRPSRHGDRPAGTTGFVPA